MIEVIAEPGIVKTWNQFLKENPPYSIALDGYVSDESREDSTIPMLNLDHHVNVKRLETNSTCAQTFKKIKEGLLEKIFNENNEPKANLYINHSDQDVALSVFLFKNHKLITSRKNDLLEELVKIEDELDKTAGMCKVDVNSEIFQKLAWIFQPYMDAKNFGLLDDLNSNVLIKNINLIENRIVLYLNGKAEKLKEDSDYKIAYHNKSKKWALIIELGTYAKTKMYNDGIESFVTFREKRNDNNFIYNLFNISLGTKHKTEDIYDILNKEEGISEDNNDRWGGNEFGGSPRIKGSKISPKKLTKIIDDYR